MTTFHRAGASASGHALRAIEVVAGGEVEVARDPIFVRAVSAAGERRVALVSGGGAGHEPMHAGFVGRGGLDAACPGEVFTSPHSIQIYEASAAVRKADGVLHIVKNYTGDRLNFAIAAERLRAEGIAVGEVVVDDDLGSENDGVGRRGTAATVIVEKVLGAAADRGLSLDELVALGQRVVASSRTLAVARAAHVPPHGDAPAFEVATGSLEYGVGIHGETARERVEAPELESLVEQMVGELLGALPAAASGVVALVNGLGGVSQIENYQVLVEVEAALSRHGVALRSAVAGDFCTALDMSGFSITLTVADDEWLADWFAPHGTVALPSPRTAVAPKPEEPACDTAAAEPSAWLGGFVEEILGAQDDLNRLDQIAGDGDVGTNLANAVKAASARASGPDAELGEDLASIARAFLDETGGSSGPLFGLVFQSLAAARGDDRPTALQDGLRQGLASVERVGGARPGDRTIVDALDAAASASEKLDEAAATAAVRGSASTREMIGRRGRSSYLGDRVLGVPDPGAVAMAYVVVLLAEAASGERLTDARERVSELLSSAQKS